MDIKPIDIVSDEGLEYISMMSPNLLYLSNILDYSNQQELSRYITALGSKDIPHLMFTQIAPISIQSTQRNEIFAWPTLKSFGYQGSRKKERGRPMEALLFSKQEI